MDKLEWKLYRMLTSRLCGGSRMSMDVARILIVKGFAPFFPELGIPVVEENAMQKPPGEEIIQRVPGVAERYGRIIPPVTA